MEGGLGTEWVGWVLPIRVGPPASSTLLSGRAWLSPPFVLGGGPSRPPSARQGWFTLTSEDGTNWLGRGEGSHEDTLLIPNEVAHPSHFLWLVGGG